MKNAIVISVVLTGLLLNGCQPQYKPGYYQIKIYSIENQRQESRLDTYLADAYIPALKRHGVESVGVFKPVEPDTGQSYIMVFIPFVSLEQFDNLESHLMQDDVYQQEGRDYIEATHDDPPFVRIESILLKAFEGSPRFRVPQLETPVYRRIYELRSYEAATERLYQRKVEMFNEGESDIFVDLGFQPVFFGEVMSGSRMPNLMYMTVFSDTTSQKDRWAAFREHPDWLAIKDLERYRNTVSHITRYLMRPAEYSDI